MNIIINARDLFHGEDLEKARLAVKDLVDQLASNLNLSRLDAIIFPDDFQAEVSKFQVEHGLAERGATRDEVYGHAFGKVLSVGSGANTQRVIFLDKSILAGLFYADYAELATHTLHHELCHVHDDFLKSGVIPDEVLQGVDLKHLLRIHGDIVWSEYIATRLAVSTTPHNSDLYLPHLLDLIPEVKTRGSKNVEAYRFSSDINELYSNVQNDASYLLKFAGTVAGYLQGLDHDRLLAIASDAISSTWFSPIWTALYDRLSELYRLYPSWRGIEELDDLGQTILNCWNTLGIYPRQMDRGTYIDVPF